MQRITAYFLSCISLLFCVPFLAHSGYDDISWYSGKLIRVNTFAQTLSYYQSGAKIGEFFMSSGDDDHATPRGRYRVWTKSDMMFSKSALKYMPYWMEFLDGKYGIHAFPEDKKGVLNTSSFPGVRAAGGCIRLQKSDAKTVYDWAELGTPIVITYDPNEFISPEDEKVVRAYYDFLNAKNYAGALALRIDRKYTLAQIQKLNKDTVFHVQDIVRQDGDLFVTADMTNKKGKTLRSFAKFRIIREKIVRSYRVK